MTILLYLFVFAGAQVIGSHSRFQVWRLFAIICQYGDPR